MRLGKELKLQSSDVLRGGLETFRSLCKNGQRPSRGMRKRIADLKAAARRLKANEDHEKRKAASAPSPVRQIHQAQATLPEDTVTINFKANLREVLDELERKRLLGHGSDRVDIKQGDKTEYYFIKLEPNYFYKNSTGDIGIGDCSTENGPIVIQRAN